MSKTLDQNPGRIIGKLREELQQLTKEKRELERELDDKREAWKHLPADYAEALVDLYNIAHYGVSTAERVGRDPNAASSRSPSKTPVAYGRWKREIKRLEKAAVWISTDLGMIIRGEPIDKKHDPKGEAA